MTLVEQAVLAFPYPYQYPIPYPSIKPEEGFGSFAPQAEFDGIDIAERLTPTLKLKRDGFHSLELGSLSLSFQSILPLEGFESLSGSIEIDPDLPISELGRLWAQPQIIEPIEGGSETGILSFYLPPDFEGVLEKGSLLIQIRIPFSGNLGEILEGRFLYGLFPTFLGQERLDGSILSPASFEESPEHGILSIRVASPFKSNQFSETISGSFSGRVSDPGLYLASVTGELLFNESKHPFVPEWKGSQSPEIGILSCVPQEVTPFAQLPEIGILSVSDPEVSSGIPCPIPSYWVRQSIFIEDPASPDRRVSLKVAPANIRMDLVVLIE